MNIDNDYLAYIFDEASLFLESKAWDGEKFNWSQIKWKEDIENDSSKNNKNLMNFIAKNT